MRAAMRLIQAKKLTEATRVIQSALSGRDQPAPPAEPAGTVRAIESPVIDLTAEVVEPDVTNVPEGGASIAPGLSLPTGMPAWTSRMSEWCSRSATARLSRLGLDALTGRETQQDCRGAGRRSVPQPVLCLRRREPRLQALHSAPPAGERARAGGDAAWRHAGWRRLRGGDPHERARRGAWPHRRLSEPVQGRKRLAVLELVHARASEARGSASRRSLPASRVRSSPITLSIRTACSSRGYPPVAPWRR